MNQVIDESCKTLDKQSCDLLKTTAKSAQTLQEVTDKAQSAIDKCNAVLSNPDIHVRKILSNTTDQDITLNINASGTIY
jgi:hypothetical protein